MKISVKFYSFFRELAGAGEMSLEVPAGSRLRDLTQAIYEKAPKLRPMEKSTLKAVGLEYQDDHYLLKDGDEVSLFPPVQGG
jgi:molybdopterin converting factor small subunit